MSTGIGVSRPKRKSPKARGFRDALRRYKVFVDDTQVASLKEGESATTEVDPGEHLIRAQVDWCAATLEVVVSADEMVSLVVRPGGGLNPLMILYQALLRPSEYLVLERA